MTQLFLEKSERLQTESTLTNVLIDNSLVLLLIVVEFLEILHKELVHFTMGHIHHMLLHILEMFVVFGSAVTTIDTFQLVEDLIGQTLDETDFVHTIGFFTYIETMYCLHMS